MPANTNHGKQSRYMTLAHRYVDIAVRNGDLPKLDGSIPCVDCGSPAHDYDHRDYKKPLDVVPVCRACNFKRGEGQNRDPSFCAPSKPLTRWQRYVLDNGLPLKAPYEHRPRKSA